MPTIRSGLYRVPRARGPAFAWIFAILTAPAWGQGFPRGGGATYIDNSSQYVGPGSTVDGDLARGMGIFYSGVGRYNYDSARARALDTQTTLTWNEYWYQSMQKYNRDRLARIQARNQKQIRGNKELELRLRDQPLVRDVLTGDSLNLLLQDLTGAFMRPSVLRVNSPPLEGQTVRLIPFQYPQAGVVISWERLMARKLQEWPVALSGPAFAPLRKKYDQAVDHAVDLAVDGRLDMPAARAVRDTVAALQAQADRTLMKEDPITRAEVRDYLKQLDAAARSLQTSKCVNAVAEIETYSGTTVADLLEFMQRFGFRFAPADTPDERQLYRELYATLRRQRQELAPEMAEAARPLDPKPGSTPLPPGPGPDPDAPPPPAQGGPP